MFTNLPSSTYDIVYADPPWSYYGDPNKMAAAGKHYDLLTNDELAKFPMKDIMSDSSALFLWATCPRLDFAIDMIKKWGLHYRGVPFVWVKTNKAGAIIEGQGIPPTFTKPTTELVLAATRVRKGRPLPLQNHAMGQVICSPRGEHSAKPSIVRNKIVDLLGDRPRIELFARERAEGLDSWGLEVANV